MSLHDLAAAALRRADPETAHGLTIRALSAGLGPRAAGADDPVLKTRLAGLDLPNALGLAAGFDKNAEVPDAMLAAGFGFVECGTVTPLAQAGNPRPRLFRLSADRGVVNRMGFNNQGLDAFADRLARRERRGIVGANIGANKDSADRIGDYVLGLRRLWGLCDYFTVNISSPNTPGLRDLQSAAALDELLGRLGETRAGLGADGSATPVFLKVAPDLDAAQIEAVAEAAVRLGMDALICGNTTISRPEDLRSPEKAETGGLSGAPLAPLAARALGLFAEALDGRLPLIAAGGIGSGAEAYGRIRAGASAVQLYSAMVFEGPGLARRIKADLAARLRADGFASVAEAVGAR